MNLLIFFIFINGFISFIYFNIYNYFFINIILFCIYFFFFYLYVVEYMNNKNLILFEKYFILILSSIPIILIILCKNIFWIIFLLEIQSFIILGNSTIFNRYNNQIIRKIEGSLIYLLPSFISFFLISLSLILISYYNEKRVWNYNLITLGLIIKMGNIPFHFWVSQVVNKISHNTIILFNSLNKISIIFILSIIPHNSFIIIFFGLISIIFGILLIINTIFIKEFIAFSSIISSGWIIIFVIFQKWTILFLFFLIYTCSLCIILKLSEKIFFIYEFKEKTSYFKNNNIKNILFIISILNIAGIPPLIGFLIKFLIIKNFLYYFHIAFNIIFIIIIITSIFPYIRPLLYNYSNYIKKKYFLKEEKEIQNINIVLLINILFNLLFFNIKYFFI